MQTANAPTPLRLQLQQQVVQLGALAGEARLGSLAYPPHRWRISWAHGLTW